MKRNSLLCVMICIVLAAAAHVTAATRDWQTGTLTEVEQEKIREGSTRHTNTEGTAKDRGNKTDYSQNSTTTTMENIETWQVYTIEGEKKVYIAREHLLFPWSKPANVTVGDSVKFAVEKGKLYILDDDGKEHKATVAKVRMKTAQ
jgi:hypothetical protein